MRISRPVVCSLATAVCLSWLVAIGWLGRAAILQPARASPVEEARAQVRALMAERGIPGLSVALAIDGRLVWAEGFGWADRERGIAAGPDTQYRIASVSKVLTAAVMARLYERGRLELDAPLRRYLPGFAGPAAAVTPRQLASHRAGVRNYNDDREAWSTRRYDSVAASLEPFERDPLLFEPGRDFRYSNYGYVMLSAAIEAAAGADFLSVVKREVLDPLGMRATLPNHADRAAPRQAAFYDTVTPYSRDGSLVVSPDNDFSSKWASGGFLSSAPDLARLGSAHVAAINSRFLGAETLETLFEPLSGTPPLLGYGLGWISARDLQLRRVHFHFGAGSGATALLAIYPEQRLVFAILCNLGHARYPMARLLGIVEPFLADPLVVPLIALVALGSLATARALRRRV